MEVFRWLVGLGGWLVDADSGGRAGWLVDTTSGSIGIRSYFSFISHNSERCRHMPPKVIPVAMVLLQAALAELV